MRKIYSGDNLMMAGYLQGLLENENIACLIKNQNLSGGIGELPPVECWPEIWIIDDDDYPRAIQIINEYNSPANSEPVDWQCKCGETIEGQFNTCWQCGAEKAG